MSQGAHVVLASQPGDELMKALTSGIEAAGVRVVQVELDSSSSDQDNDIRVREVLPATPEGLVLGGFSLGARIAARLCPELRPAGLLCFGYPFHRAGDATARHGLEALRRVDVPTRIVQGTRDSHGSEADVRGYALGPHIEMSWLRDGNHRFVPRERSGLTYEAHLDAAVSAALSFLRAR